MPPMDGVTWAHISTREILKQTVIFAFVIGVSKASVFTFIAFVSVFFSRNKLLFCRHPLCFIAIFFLWISSFLWCSPIAWNSDGSDDQACTPQYQTWHLESGVRHTANTCLHGSAFGTLLFPDYHPDSEWTVHPWTETIHSVTPPLWTLLSFTLSVQMIKVGLIFERSRPGSRSSNRKLEHTSHQKFLRETFRQTRFWIHQLLKTAGVQKTVVRMLHL